MKFFGEAKDFMTSTNMDRTTSDKATPLKNVGYLGRCYDILKLNPLDLDGPDSALPKSPFDLDQSQQKPVNTGNNLVPVVVNYYPGSGGSYSEEAKLVFTAYDYQSTFKQGVNFEVGIPDVFAFSTSVTYSSFKQETGSEENLYTYIDFKQELHTLTLDLDYQDQSQFKLRSDFKNAVKSLPHDKNDGYQQFIKDFGTHFTTDVKFGGRAYLWLKVSKTTYSTLQQEGLSVKVGVKGTFKKITASAGSETTTEDAKKFEELTNVSSTNIQFDGGTPNPNLNEWVKTVENNPAPININLKPLYKLFTSKFFPDDPNIDAKRARMEQVVKDYVKTGEEPEQYIPQFKLPLPPLKYNTVVQLWTGNRCISWMSSEYLGATASKQYYPKLSTQNPVGLQLTGSKGQLLHNSTVRIETTEGSVGNYKILGAWSTPSLYYYYWYGNQQQWTIQKKNGKPGDQIRYNDEVYFVNQSYSGQWLKDNGDYLTTESNANCFWKVKWDGYYTITSKKSGKAVDVANGSTADGANIQQYQCNGSDAQFWRLESAGNGYYFIISKKSGKVLDVEGSSTADSANVCQWTKHDGDNQKWKLEEAGDGCYYLINKKSGKALDVATGSTADGANIQQYTRNGTDAQKWKFE